MTSPYLEQPVRTREQAMAELISKARQAKLVWEEGLITHYLGKLAGTYDKLTREECDVEYARVVGEINKAARLANKGYDIPINAHDARCEGKARLTLLSKRIAELT